MVEPDVDVRTTSSRTIDAESIAYLMCRININQQSGATSAMLVDDGQLKTGDPTVVDMKNEQEEKTKKDLKEYYNLDGLNCSICIEPWTLDGDHQVSSLRCGHIYGLSCINKWIELRGVQRAKCPQCKAKIGSNDVTKIYASPVVLVDENKLKKDEMSKAAYLEIEKSNLLLIQDSLLKELRLVKKQVSSGTVYHEANWRKANESVIGGLVHETQNGNIYGGMMNTGRCNFVLEHEMGVENARLFDMDASYKVMLLARRVPGKGGSCVLNKINMMNPTVNEEISLPVSTNAVKDLHISPCGRLALLASLGKQLSLISMGGNSIVMTYKLPSPAWSCSWDNNSPNYMYAGLQDGMLLVFDMRSTLHPVESMHGIDSRAIHTIHPYNRNIYQPQQLLTASTTGPSLWNINCGMERSFKVPELETNEASCMSLAYSSLSEDIITTYRPKNQEPVFSEKRRPVSNPMVFAPSSLVLVKRVASSVYFKLKSASAQLGHEQITKSTVINVDNCLPIFAYGNDVANGLRLLEIPSLSVTQNLKPHQHPILDVKYSRSQGSCLLGCISRDKLQLFSAKIL